MGSGSLGLCQMCQETQCRLRYPWVTALLSSSQPFAISKLLSASAFLPCQTRAKMHPHGRLEANRQSGVFQITGCSPLKAMKST